MSTDGEEQPGREVPVHKPPPRPEEILVGAVAMS